MEQHSVLEGYNSTHSCNVSDKKTLL